MPKGRHLKPDFFTDMNIVGLSPLARLLYQGLWCYAHDCGHLDDEPVELKMRILPADNCDVDALLDELVWHKRIGRKGGVIEVPKLAEHQKPDKRYMTLCDDCRDEDDNPGERKRWGLHKRWHIDRSLIKEDCEFCRDEHVVTTTSERPQEVSTRSEHVVTTTGSRSDHVVDGDGDGDGDGEVKSARKRATQLPSDFTPNETNRKIADERHLDLASVLEQFSDYHRAKGSTFKDWHAALNTWLRREKPGRPVTRPRALPHASQIRRAPSGLSDEQYEAWLREGS